MYDNSRKRGICRRSIMKQGHFRMMSHATGLIQDNISLKRGTCKGVKYGIVAITNDRLRSRGVECQDNEC